MNARYLSLGVADINRTFLDLHDIVYLVLVNVELLCSPPLTRNTTISREMPPPLGPLFSFLFFFVFHGV